MDTGLETPPERGRPPPTSVLVVDDDAYFRGLVATVLDGIEDIVIVAEASSGVEAVFRARELAPRVVLLDLSIPGGGGIDAARKIHKLLPLTAVVMLTASDDGPDVHACLKAGASSYVLKQNLEDLPAVIRTVNQGLGVLLSTGIAKTLLDNVGLDQDHPSVPILSDREVQVLALVAMGRTNDDIARELWLSSHTVKRHVANILSKLHERSRADAVAHALREGVLPGDRGETERARPGDTASS